MYRGLDYNMSVLLKLDFLPNDELRSSTRYMFILIFLFFSRIQFYSFYYEI